MKRLASFLCILGCLSNALALETADLLKGSPALEILNKKCIRAENSGFLPIPYSQAIRIMSRPDLPEAVQAEYAKSVSTSGKVDLPLIRKAPGHLYYINPKGKRVDLLECYKQPSELGVFDYIILATGKRFFGSYDVVIHLKMLDAGDAGVAFISRIHAYPHSRTIRFFARRLGTVERFFRKHTHSISAMARTIAIALSQQENLKPEIPTTSIVGPQLHPPIQ